MKFVLFHKNCTDGLFSALAFYSVFGKDAVYLEVSHRPLLDLSIDDTITHLFNKENKFNLGNADNSNVDLETCFSQDNWGEIELYILDFCLRYDQLIELSKIFKSITVIDHHKTSYDSVMEKYEGVVVKRPTPMTDENSRLPSAMLSLASNCTFHYFEDQSGALATWNVLYGTNGTVPRAIKLVSDRDLWKFEYGETKPFDAGIRALKSNSFDELLPILDHYSEEYGAALNKGYIIEQVKSDYIESIFPTGTMKIDIWLRDREMKGMLIANSVPDFISEGCDYALKNNPGVEIAINYTILADGKVLLSIRSNKYVNSSIISLKFGGGGHANANGCQIDYETFFEIVRTKRLEIE